MRTARSSGRPGGGLHQAPEEAPLRRRHPPGPGTPPRGQTHACKHITLPQTSFAGGNDIHKEK